MEEHVSLINTLFERTEQYAKASLELYKLRAIEKYSEVASSLIIRLSILLFIVFFFFVFNIGLSFWIGELLGRAYYGFFAVAGFYAFFGTLLYTFRNKWVKTALRNSIITQALN
jgi:hypothetical protein